MSGYANPQSLVSTAWLAENLGRSGLRVIEVSLETKLYAAGHIPGAVALDWERHLQDPVARDIVGVHDFEIILSRLGVHENDTVVLYGDRGNWFAAYAFWIFSHYGHRDVRLLNGGRSKWLSDPNLPIATDVPKFERSAYRVPGVNTTIRARLGDVLLAAERRSHDLIDVRSPDEFSGRIIAPPGLPESAQRAGHIPGARNIPWNLSVNDDGTFKDADELRLIYGEQDHTPAITYCRIGERSSLTWFVLRFLLGRTNVKNYDGSWTEYGNTIGLPIANPSKEFGTPRTEPPPPTLQTSGEIRSPLGRLDALAAGHAGSRVSIP